MTDSPERAPLTDDQAGASGASRVRSDGERLQLIGETSSLLATALDEGTLLERLTALVVPRLADGLVVHERQGEAVTLRWLRHREPGRQRALEALAAHHAIALTQAGSLGSVLRTGASWLQREVTPAWLDGVARDDGHRRLLDALAPRSLLVVAVAARGETLGAMCFVSHDPDTLYDESDRRVAEYIGQQVGAALSNARLHARAEREGQRLRDLVGTIPGIVWESWGVPDAGTQRIDYVSEHVQEMLGYTREEWLSTPNFWLTIVHPDDRASAVARARQKFEGRTEPGDAYGNEFRWIAHDGRVLWVRSESSVVRGPGGEPLGMRGFTFDITARKQNEAARAALEAEARESERKFRAVAETMPQLVWTTRPDGFHEYFNQRWFDYTGTSLEQARGDGWSRLLHPDDLARSLDAWSHSVATGEPYEIEYRLRRASDGVFRWFLGRALPLRDEAGRIQHWFGTCTEIDAQRRASDAQRFLAEVTNALVDTLDLPQTLRQVARRVVPHLADWCALDLLSDDGAAPRLERVEAAHVDPAKVEVAWQLWRGFPPDLGSTEGVAEVIRSRRSQRRRDITPAMIAGAPVPAAQRELLLSLGLRSSLVVPLVARGRVLGALSLVMAESERHFEADDEPFAEELAARIALAVDNASLIARLRVNERRYRSLVDASLQTVWTNNRQGEMVGEQPGWAALTGQGPEQYRGHGWARAIHPDDRAATLAAWQQAVADRTPYAVEHRVRVHDGSHRDYTARGVPVLDDAGEVLEWVGVHTDVTARKAVERERERLIEALGRSNQDLDQFAYIASHDLKAPLRGIANLSHWIEDDLEAVLTDETREHMKLMRGRVRRLEGLIDGILSYSRAIRGREPSEAVDVGQLVGEAVELLSPPSTITWQVAPDLPTVEAERVPLQQVFLNLLGNAIKYAGPGATIAVTAREVGDLHEFAVTDDGPGIAPEFHDRIWGIFQTLAPRDRVESTGIGLAVVKKVVESHGGRVSVRSAAGQGSTFAFTWPRVTRPGWSAA